MDSADSRFTVFEQALLHLEASLAAKRWDHAARAGEILAEVSDSCRRDGVMLPPAMLARSQESYQRCTQMALAWGEILNHEAQSAASSSRAFHTYARMDSEAPAASEALADINEPAR